MAWPWKKDDDQDDVTQDLQKKWGQMYDWYEPPSNTQAESVTPDIQKQWSETYDWYTPSQTHEPEPPKQNIWQKAGQVLEQSKDVDPERVTGFQRAMGAEPTQDESLGGAIGKGAGWMGRNLWAGVGDFSNAFYRGLQSVGLDYVPGVKDALDYGVGATKHAQEMGDSGIGAQVIRTLPGMIPNMALTYMGGGAMAPAQLGASVNPAVSAVKGLATNPAFINSAIRTYGSTYGEAVDEGATRGQAIKAGLMNAIPSAMIEVGGGIEKLPEKAGQGLLKTIGSTALEEGMEEVFQYPFEGMAKKATYAPDTPIFSLKDQAVINPAHMAHGGLVGGLAGGIFGGAGGAMNQVRAGKGVNIDVNPELEVQPEVQTEAQPEVQPNPDFIVDPYGNVSQDIDYQAPLLLQPGPEGLQIDPAVEMEVNNVPLREVLSTDTSTGEVFKEGEYVYKNTTSIGWKGNRSAPKPTVEAEVYSVLKGNDNVLDGTLVDYEGEPKIRTPYVENIVSTDTIPKNKRASIGKNIVSENFNNIVDAVQALSNEGYSYSDPLQFGYHDGKLKLMDFSNASKTDIETATAENYSALTSFLNAFGLDGYADTVSEGMRILDDLQTHTASEILKGDMLAEPAHIEMVQQAARAGIEPHNVYFARNARMVQTKTPVGQTENANGVTYVFSERPLSQAEINEWELSPIYQKHAETTTQGNQLDRLAYLNLPIAEAEPDYTQGQSRVDMPFRVFPGEVQNPLEGMQHPIDQTPVQTAQEADTDVLSDTLPNTLAEQEAAAMAEPETVQQADMDIEDMSTPEYRRQYRQGLRDQAAEDIEGSEHAKDKKAGFWHRREIMERNNIDVFGEELGGKINEAYFRGIKDKEAGRTTFINKHVDRVKALNLTKKESQYVQALGEGQITEADLPKGVDPAKIQNAIGEFRAMYDNLLQLANAELVRNGYAPVEYRKDYFPHFQDPTDPFARVMQTLGFKVDDITLPTDLAGITHQLRPGKKWFGHFLERKGDKTTYDAVQGFEKYLHGISDVIYHTENIQKLRALETALRGKFSSDNVQAQIDAIYQSDMPADLQQAAVDELLSVDRGHLGNYVTNLRNFTDSLAGKKAITDRNMEHNFSRASYNIFDNMNKQVGKGMVNFNVTSWFTNFIPLAQAGGGVKAKNLAKAAFDTTINYVNDDGFRAQSSFLTSRKGVKRLSPSVVETISEAGMAPMELIDDFTVQTLTRAKYYDNIESGMSHTEAINNANDYTAGAVGDRSKGSMPTLFMGKNPINKLFTLFQLEVNNQYSFFLKDLPREAKKQASGYLAGALLKAAVGSYLYNELYERLFGRRAALDPIGMVKDALKKGTPLDGIKSIARDIAEETPFIGGLLGGGRLPTQEALPDFRGMMQAAETMQDGDIWGGLGDMGKAALTKPATFLLSPVGGGNQARKTIGGLKAYNQGASITDKGQMRFPIEQTPGNLIKMAIAGQYATKEGRAYFDEDRRPLSAKQTEQVQKSADPQKEYDRILLQRQIENIQSEIKKVAKDKSMSLGERDKKIIELRNEMEKLRAAGR